MFPALFTYLLHLADNNLILGQRNSEWTGHGPVLEQDIAITNISLDHLGQARNFYQHAARLYNQFQPEEKKEVAHLVPRLWKTFNRDLEEDDLAFLRDEHQYLNLLITEGSKGDWAVTTLRQFFFSAFQVLQYSALKESRDDQLRAIAEKSLKEATYHLRWSSEWVIRLGDGTEESRRRMQTALTDLWNYTGELFQPAPYELALTAEDDCIDPASLKKSWLVKVEEVLTAATFSVPQNGWMQSGGKLGKHSEQLGFLLAEMQYMQRTFPNETW